MDQREASGPDERRDATRVVIVGGGFGGLAAARALARAPVQVTLVDRSNHHTFQPLLYQVATAGLAAPDIAEPIRQVVRHQRNTRVLMADVASVDLARRVVRLAAGEGVTELPYDRLILAPGALPNFFGHEAWAAHAPGLKDCADAVAIRRRILLAFEAAEREDDPARRARWLTFAVIGGGPTGVELAGALADIARHTLARNFRRFDPADARIVLIEAGPRLLPTFAPVLSDIALGRLHALGVQVRLNTRVTDVDATGLQWQSLDADPSSRERLDCGAMVWAAGVRPSPLVGGLGVPVDRSGRALVGADLTLPGHPEVAVIGDAAAVRDTAREQAERDEPAGRAGAASHESGSASGGASGGASDGASGGASGGAGGVDAGKRAAPRTVPGLAPAALQMGRHAARNIERALAGEAPLPFRYRDKGNLATIGRSSAVAQFGRRTVSGPLAWLLWAGVHIAYLIGFRNRLAVLLQWAWLWLTKQRGARVILERRDDRLHTERART